MLQNHLKRMTKIHISGAPLPPRVLDSVSLGQGPWICVCDEFPGDTAWDPETIYRGVGAWILSHNSEIRAKMKASRGQDSGCQLSQHRHSQPLLLSVSSGHKRDYRRVTIIHQPLQMVSNLGCIFSNARAPKTIMHLFFPPKFHSCITQQNTRGLKHNLLYHFHYITSLLNTNLEIVLTLKIKISTLLVIFNRI